MIYGWEMNKCVSGATCSQLELHCVQGLVSDSMMGDRDICEGLGNKCVSGRIKTYMYFIHVCR